MNTEAVLKLLERAEEYDKKGHFHMADRIMQKLQPYVSQLPREAQLRITSHSISGPQSAGSIEGAKGFMYLKGGELNYFSGKGQQAYKDTLPMDMVFA